MATFDSEPLLGPTEPQDWTITYLHTDTPTYGASLIDVHNKQCCIMVKSPSLVGTPKWEAPGTI